MTEYDFDVILDVNFHFREEDSVLEVRCSGPGYWR